MNKEAVKAILEKVFRQEATPDEYSILMEWIRTDEGYEFSDLITESIATHGNVNAVSDDIPYDHEYWNSLCKEILSREIYSIGLPFAAPEKKVVKLRSRKWYWAGAASILVLLSAATWSLFNNKRTEPVKTTQIAATPDFQPGKNKAILVLADGSNIILDSAGNGKIAVDSGIIVNKNGGRLEYSQAGENNYRSNQYNILSTPRGGQYQLMLPDGSTVWLNAASSIKYPVAFPNNERIVTITGEAYFEVKKDVTRPFIVKGGGQEVQVLGTAFNMNVYEDEPLKKITLINGSVQVQELQTHTGKDIQLPIKKEMLKPGQQAKVNRANNQMEIVDVDTDEATAWKNGYFYTRKADIGELMRQIGRWFDVEVDLSQLPADKVKPLPTFSGRLNRNLTLSQIVKILELSDVKLQIEGKQITILP